MRRSITCAMLLPASAAIAALAAAADPPAGENEPVMIPAHIAAQMAAAQGGGEGDELPKLADVAKEYEKVVSTTDGRSLYTLWKRDRDGQMLAELPRNFEKQLLFIAYTVAGGTPFSGVQTGDMYAQWKKYDKKLALIEPNYAVRTSGDLESRKGHERVFTDRVILEVPIVAKGESGGPVIDLDGLLVGQAQRFFGFAAQGINPGLLEIEKAKAFPENIEVAYEVPLSSGRLGTLHYSFKVMPENTGYSPRQADERVGYFTTTYRDIGDPSADTQWKRYINRWKLEKADSRLKLSPPKEPIVFYLEHTIPVRYRRWVRDGVLEWNNAFEKVGIVNAVEVYQQDARTGAHMDKDPEDARYNFVLWTNASMGFAIGPSRVDPRTGQILDADIVMDEGFITSWVNAWRKVIPEQAMEGFGPQVLSWLETRPQWDPRVRLAAPSERAGVIAQLQRQRMMRAQGHDRDHGFGFGGHPAGAVDATLLGDDLYDGLSGRISQVNGLCLSGTAKTMDMALFRLNPEIFIELARQEEGSGGDEGDEGDEGEGDEDETEEESDETDEPKPEPKEDEGDMLDGVPDWFVGPLLRDVIMHEVGHTLGLRHNFKASTCYGLAEINSEEMKGHAHTGSVMDYNPVNVNFGDGEAQGDYTMVTIGPYDYWAIEYGYTQEKDLEPVLAKVAEHDHRYATDEDTWGPDPTARRFDFGADPLNYAESQMRLVRHLRSDILDRMVKEGESWSKARQGYEILLSKHFGAVSIAANWVGGSYVNRDKKGDPGDRDPVTPVEAERQRRALNFVLENTFNDEAFGLTPELLSKMTVDKWWDEGGFRDIMEDPTWPVHDRISGLQAAALTMVLNPMTLNRVLDVEYRVPADEDAMTVADVILDVSDAVWTEVDQRPNKTYTARQPMVSSLRRNLQSEHVSRLIDLSMPNHGFGAAAKPVSNLSIYYLRQLESKLDDMLEKHRAKLDPYTIAHFSEAQVRINKALDAQYIYNTDDISAGGGMPMFFMEPEAQPSR